MNVNEIKSYYQDNGKWKECEFLSGEEMAQRATEMKQAIAKAIEYIENNWIEYSDFQYVDNDDELNIDCESIKELIDILKGSDSNGHNKE